MTPSELREAAYSAGAILQGTDTELEAFARRLAQPVAADTLTRYCETCERNVSEPCPDCQPAPVQAGGEARDLKTIARVLRSDSLKAKAAFESMQDMAEQLEIIAYAAQPEAAAMGAQEKRTAIVSKQDIDALVEAGWLWDGAVLAYAHPEAAVMGAVSDAMVNAAVEAYLDAHRNDDDNDLHRIMREVLTEVLALRAPTVQAARQEQNLIAVEMAGMESSIGHLGALVDELRRLLADAMQSMKTLEASATPDESTEDIDATIPGAAFAEFVNQRARLLFEINNGCAASPAAAQQEMQPMIDWVVGRWYSEVADRPLVNVHRRSLDDSWRQILRHLGVDDRARLGPTHDELLTASAATSEG